MDSIRIGFEYSKFQGKLFMSMEYNYNTTYLPDDEFNVVVSTKNCDWNDL